MAKNTMRIRLKAYEHRILDDSAKKIVEAATKHGAKKVVGPVPLPTEKQVVTILRAVHKYKDSREQFEIRTHKRLRLLHQTRKRSILYKDLNFLAVSTSKLNFNGGVNDERTIRKKIRNDTSLH